MHCFPFIVNVQQLKKQQQKKILRLNSSFKLGNRSKQADLDIKAEKNYEDVLQKTEVMYVHLNVNITEE